VHLRGEEERLVYNALVIDAFTRRGIGSTGEPTCRGCAGATMVAVTAFFSSFRQPSMTPFSSSHQLAPDPLLYLLQTGGWQPPCQEAISTAGLRASLGEAILRVEACSLSEVNLSAAEAACWEALQAIRARNSPEQAFEHESLRVRWMSYRLERERRAQTPHLLDVGPLRGDLLADVISLEEELLEFGSRCPLIAEVQRVAAAVRRAIEETPAGSARAAAIVEAGARIRWSAFGSRWLGAAIAIEMASDAQGYAGHMIPTDCCTTFSLRSAERLLFGRQRFPEGSDGIEEDAAILDIEPLQVASIIREEGAAIVAWQHARFWELETLKHIPQVIDHVPAK